MQADTAHPGRLILHLFHRRIPNKPGAPACSERLELIKGAFIRSDWGNAGQAAAPAPAFSTAVAFQITRANAYKDFAISQVKWMPAIAPFRQSYLVGYLNGPTAPHHRNDVAMGNVTRLKGGIVSGPTL